MNTLDKLMVELERCRSEAIVAFETANNEMVLEELREKFLFPKGGWLKEVQKLLGSLSYVEKPFAGQMIINFKTDIFNSFHIAKQRIITNE